MTDAFEGDVDLAAERLGGAALWATDDFFAEKENLLKAAKPVFLEHEYTDRGKWMDGWESRRKRPAVGATEVEGAMDALLEGGSDACIVRLGVPGIVTGVVVDTAFFRGNYPEACTLEGCFTRSDARPEELLGEGTEWFELLPRKRLEGDKENRFAVSSTLAVSHVRLRIHPDGGVARLRVHGRVVPDWRSLGGTAGVVDLAALECGGQVLLCSDMFFGPKHNLVMPGRAANMGDGWESRRRRKAPWRDWVIVKLAGPGQVRRVEVDTNHFKGNFPDTCSLEACGLTPGQDLESANWAELLPPTKLQAHTRHTFVEELRDVGVATHVRLTVYPDGGVSRLRVHGSLTHEGRIALGLQRFNAVTKGRAMEALAACCGVPRWTEALAAGRPYGAAETLYAAAQKVEGTFTEEEWRQAFAHHPRIGDRGARGWSAAEQAGVAGAESATRAALVKVNEDYEARFGHVYLVCATGKSAQELLDTARARLGNEPAAELAVAAAELRKINRLRLERLLLP